MFGRLLHNSSGQGKKRVLLKTGALLVVVSLFWMMQIQLPFRADAGQNFTTGTQINGNTPTVASISPNSESMTGPTAGTIAGTGFSMENTGTVNTIVYSAGGTSPVDQFVYALPVAPGPTVNAISPNSGSTAGGTMVTITGTGFTSATDVMFGSGTATGVKVNSSTSITATSPAGSAGVVDVTVVTPDGTSAASSADQFTYTASNEGPINVLNYGADPTGVNDSTNAITAAITAAKSGNLIYFSPGTYLISRPLTLYNYIVYEGAGSELTTIKLANSANCDIFESNNFASLTGTNSNGGIAGTTIEGMTLNGNKANNSSGWGIQKYGYRNTLNDVQVCYCASGGIYSEWGTTAGYGADGGMMEDSWNSIRTYNNGGNGITMYGPHDSRWDNILTYNNAGYGAQIWSGANYSATGLMIGKIHAYSNVTGITIKTAVIAADMMSENNTAGDGIDVLGNDCDLNVYCFGNPANGLTLGSSTTPVAGEYITGKINYNPNQLNLAGDEGDNFIYVVIYNITGETTSKGKKNSGSTYVITGG